MQKKKERVIQFNLAVSITALPIASSNKLIQWLFPSLPSSRSFVQQVYLLAFSITALPVASSNYSAALKCFLEAGAAASLLFTTPVPSSTWDEQVRSALSLAGTLRAHQLYLQRELISGKQELLVVDLIRWFALAWVTTPIDSVYIFYFAFQVYKKMIVCCSALKAHIQVRSIIIDTGVFLVLNYLLYLHFIL